MRVDTRIPLPLILATVIVAAGVVVFYIAMLPKFVWTNVANASTIALPPGGTYAFLVVGTSATVSLNASTSVSYGAVPVPAVYSATPITGNISTPKGVLVYLSNASGVYLRYDVASGCSFYLAQAAPNIWVPDLAGSYAAVDPSYYTQQIVSLSYSSGAVTFTTRGGSTCSVSVTAATTTATFLSLSMAVNQISSSTYVYWGYVVAVTTSAPLKVTITP